MCLGLFVAPVCFLAADEIITILYGSNWEGSVVCFRLLSIAIIPQMINSSAGSIFQAIGNTKLLFLNSCINTGITVAAICIGVFGGKSITELSLCVAIAYLCHFVTAFFMLIKMGFKYKLGAFEKELLPEVFMLIIMVAAIYLYPFQIRGMFFSMIAKCLYLAIVYIILLFLSREYKLFASSLKK